MDVVTDDTSETVEVAPGVFLTQLAAGDEQLLAVDVFSPPRTEPNWLD